MKDSITAYALLKRSSDQNDEFLTKVLQSYGVLVIWYNHHQDVAKKLKEIYSIDTVHARKWEHLSSAQYGHCVTCGKKLRKLKGQIHH